VHIDVLSAGAEIAAFVACVTCTWLPLALMTAAVVGCGRSPSAPTPVAPEEIHNTLNAAGADAPFDGVGSERWAGYDQQVYDDFEAPAAYTIGAVAWQGIHRIGLPPARFYLSFITDNGRGFPLLQADSTNSGRPPALYATSFSADQVNERLDVTKACEYLPLEQCGTYEYSVTLIPPFTTASNARYWLLIQAESPLDSPSSWVWRKGRPDNAFSTSTIANWTFFWDFAFALRR
jgi:hypothetical protein